ncbi:MAG: hypothetical protein JXQ75_07015 [Phycisphaerae bacterium]|nr:hypothetical protein [Phycisphaerae bacterium]
MESVGIEVPRRRSIRGGDCFEVFGDVGTGEIDGSAALTDKPVAYWEGLPSRRGHLLDGHLSAMHLDNVIPDGHLCGRHVAAEHLWPAALLVFRSRPLYFGTFQFAVGTVDCVGNESAELSTPVQSVVNSSPRPALSLAKSGFDENTRRLTFSFSASPDL